MQGLRQGLVQAPRGAAHCRLSPGLAASSPSPWSGSGRAAGTSAQLSASWRSQDPVPSCTY